MNFGERGFITNHSLTPAQPGMPRGWREQWHGSGEACFFPAENRLFAAH